MPREMELNSFWLNISRDVREGDFTAYTRNYHEDAVYISDTSQTSIPISVAFSHWRQSFTDTKKAKIKIDLQFKFIQRTGDEKTAFETGFFRYVLIDEAGLKTEKIIHIDARECYIQVK